MVVARLAPSPTGSLHLGNVRTFLWAWLSARAQNGRVIMRIEDLDTPRVKPGFSVAQKMLDDLLWLGLDWDEGPAFPLEGESGVRLPEGPQGPYIQTQRRAYYREIHAQLAGRGLIYPCVCTRSDILAAQSAPHEGDAEIRYPRICHGRFDCEKSAFDASGRVPAWRVLVEPGSVAFDDLLYGKMSVDVHGTVGDFVVARAPDSPAYQLAVVADDIAMGVTEVVRGDDLVASTGRQVLLYRMLGEEKKIPRYGHVPLVVGPDGKRLAKRHGDARIASLREAGVRPERIIGVLARWSGMNFTGDATPRDLIRHWSWQTVSRERVVMTREMLGEFG